VTPTKAEILIEALQWAGDDVDELAHVIAWQILFLSAGGDAMKAHELMCRTGEEVNELICERKRPPERHDNVVMLDAWRQ